MNEGVLVCPNCKNPLLKTGSFLTCPYDKFIITIESYKSNDLVRYSPKELADIEAENKKKAKEEHIELEKKKRSKC